MMAAYKFLLASDFTLVVLLAVVAITLFGLFLSA